MRLDTGAPGDGVTDDTPSAGPNVPRSIGSGLCRSLVCWLLLLALPVASTDLRSAALRSATTEPVLPPAFVGARASQWRTASTGLDSSVCRRHPHWRCLGPPVMVAAHRGARSGDSQARLADGGMSGKKTVRAGSSDSNKGMSTSTPTPAAPAKRRRRGLGSRTDPAFTGRRDSASLRQGVASTGVFSEGVSPARSKATAKTIEKIITDEFLNQEALLRQAARELLRSAGADEVPAPVAAIDDMAGGSRWGTHVRAAGAKLGRQRQPASGANSRHRRQAFEGGRQKPADAFSDENEHSITDALVGDNYDFVGYSPDLEQEWQAQRSSVARSVRGKGRLRSRLRSIEPYSGASRSGEESEYLEEVSAHRELVQRNLLRQSTMLTKGRPLSDKASGRAPRGEQQHRQASLGMAGLALKLASQKQPSGLSAVDEGDEIFFNPGFVEQRRAENERVANSGELRSGVALGELERRGLVAATHKRQDLLRGASAVAREVDAGGAVFDLCVVGGALFCAGSDDAVAIYDAESWEKTGELEGHTGWVNALCVDHARQLLYTASEDESVKVWDLATRTCVQTLHGHEQGAVSLALVGDGRLAVGCTGHILVWDTESWQLVERLSNHTHVLRAMSDGRQMSKNLDVDPQVAMAREASKLAGLKVGGIAVSRKHIFTAVDEGRIWVWAKGRAMELERKLLGPASGAGDGERTWVRSVAVIGGDGDGRRRGRGRGGTAEKLLSGWADGALRVYDLSTWKLEHTLTAHSGPILALTVNGGRVVTTGADMTAAEWDPATWTLKRVMRNHDGAVSAAAELSGGEILTASLDGKLKVWGEDSGLPVKKTVPAAPAARTRPARRQMAVTASWPQGR